MYLTKKDFEDILHGTEKRISMINNELEQLKGSILVCRKKGNRIYYSERRGKQEVGISKNKERIYQLLKGYYLKLQLDALENNRILFNACKNKYVDLSSEYMLEKMSEKYKDIPIEEIMTRSYDDWGKRRYEKNPYYEENLKFETNNGILVRSKSERQIANALEELNIQYRYDAAIDCDDVKHYADFLIKRPDGSLLIWEHFGREHDRQYMAKNRERIKDYISIGYRPWDDLVWTLESDLNDSKTIRRIVKRFILCEV